MTPPSVYVVSNICRCLGISSGPLSLSVCPRSPRKIGNTHGNPLENCRESDERMPPQHKGLSERRRDLSILFRHSCARTDRITVSCSSFFLLEGGFVFPFERALDLAQRFLHDLNRHHLHFHRAVLSRPCLQYF